MLSTNVAVILAAGNGSRLRTVAGALPKPLVPLNGTPLLEHVMLAAQEAGIERFVIVVGYRGDAIRSWVTERNLPGITVNCVDNLDYHKANGVSLLKARHLLTDPFLLLMSDHVFEPETAAALLRERVQKDGVILAVDRKLESIFDMDDATKVRCIADFVIDIGKEIPRYNAVDTGMFVCTPGIFTALDRATMNANCSLSDGMRILAAERKLRAFDIGEGIWQDVDTPEALEFGSNIHFEPFTSAVAEGLRA